MTTRRTFIKKTAFVSAALFGNSPKSLTAEIQRTSRTAAVAPIVISTWSFGIQANAAAWNVLSKKGKLWTQ